jgi:hypothetical protein
MKALCNTLKVSCNTCGNAHSGGCTKASCNKGENYTEDEKTVKARQKAIRDEYAMEYLRRMEIGAQRYEKLRRLNAQQFADLFKAHISGNIPFDTMVDQLEEE